MIRSDTNLIIYLAAPSRKSYAALSNANFFCGLL